jgi:hypothetical protein
MSTLIALPLSTTLRMMTIKEVTSPGGQFSGGHAVTVGMLRLYCGRLESRYFEAPSPEEKE